MFSTTKSKFQLQPRTTVLSQPFPSAQESPSYPIASVHSAPVRSEGVWADLISLQKPSTNASLPLQYQAPTTNLSGTSCSNTMAAGTSTNPFNSMTGLSTAGSFHQKPFAPNMLMQQPLGLESSFSPSTSGPSLQSTSPFTPSNLSPSGSSPLFQMQAPPQISPAIPFYQPQPQSSFLGTPQQPQFLSPSPNISFPSSSPNLLFASPSPQLLSPTPTVQQPSSAFNTNTISDIGLRGGVSGYLTSGSQPIMSGAHGHGLQASIMPNTMFGNGTASVNNNPFVQMQSGHGGFPAQSTKQWGL